MYTMRCTNTKTHSESVVYAVRLTEKEFVDRDGLRDGFSFIDSGGRKKALWNVGRENNGI